ncbi:MAG: hypothetical protein EBU01_05655, partial [Crocinitomicaceae bacterium]|nr:hypothetical protein [Crocinitomicaceae bacterium]
MGAPNVSSAIYHESSLITPVEDWNNFIVNGANDANTGYYANPNGKVFGWTIAYSDLNTPGTLVTDGSWIKGFKTVSGGGDVTSNRYNTATLLFLCPAFYDSASDFIAGTPVSGLVPIYIGVLHYLSGKTPITYPPDSITVSGLTNADYVVFYKTDYLYTSTDTWKVSQRFFLTGTSTPLNSLISYSISSLVDSTNVASTYTQLATVYFLKQTPLVYKMSFYANLTNATSGIANYDNYKDISGASIGRIAYSLTSNSGSDIGMVDGGSINGYGTSWNLLDSSGNAYLSNPVNFTQS